MKSSVRKIGVLTSGGDSPGMNACIRAVVRTAIYHGIEAVGFLRGFDGVVESDWVPMPSHAVSNIIQRGGTILKTARSQAFRSPEGRARAYDSLRKLGVDGLVVIGGDGSYTGAKVFLEEYPDLRIMGCPGTIDNDLYGTDYTIGYDTAINTAMRAIDNIRDTADATDRLFFVEVMGKDAGLIALRTGIGSGAEAVLIPETPTDVEQLIRILEKGWARKKSSSIIVVAEGDDAGGAFAVAEKVQAKFSSYETKVAILGHIQRGGSPSCADRILASRLGTAAVDALRAGRSGAACGVMHRDVVEIPFQDAIKHNRGVNPNLLRLVEVLST